MNYKIIAFELTSDKVIAHIKADETAIEFEIDRQDFEDKLPRSGDLIDCSFTGYEDGEEKYVPLALTLSEYWTSGGEVNDEGIINHLTGYLIVSELEALRLQKQLTMQLLMEKLPTEALATLSAYNDATHEYYTKVRELTVEYAKELKPAA